MKRIPAPQYYEIKTFDNVNDFCVEHPRGAYVLGLRNHVVAVIDGHYYDTWDCGERPVLYYWTLEV